MPEFLLELYVSHGAAVAARQGAERARIAAGELTREGASVRCLRTIFVPEDETCFLLLEADSIAVVREAARRADLTFERVVEAVAVSKGGND